MSNFLDGAHILYSQLYAQLYGIVVKGDMSLAVVAKRQAFAQSSKAQIIETALF